jgi:hypothetical protein
MTVRLLALIAVVFAVVASSACAQEQDMVLELKDIQFFKVQETKGASDTLRLTGLVFHSSLGVRNVTTAEHGDAFEVLVHLAPATQQRSGNLGCTLVIPKSSQKVTFGVSHAVIWDRATGIVPAK